MQKQNETTRVILANGSAFLHEVLQKAINKNENLQIVADVRDITNYPQVAQRVNADWTYLLLHPDDEIPGVVEDVLSKSTSMRLLVMTTDGSRIRVKWMEQHEQDLMIDELDEIFNLIQDKSFNLEKYIKKSQWITQSIEG